MVCKKGSQEGYWFVSVLHVFVLASIVILVIVLIMTLISILSFVIIISEERERSKSEGWLNENDPFRYKFLRIDSRSNSTTQGIVESRNRMKFGDMTTTNDGNIHSLLSRFEDEEFICSGSCYCETEIIRKSSLSTTTTTSTSSRVIKGLTYLVSSVIALSIAMKHAEEYFENECSEEPGFDDCDMINSEVEECHKFLRHSEIEAKYDIQIDRRDSPDTVLFSCEGYCMPIEFDQRIPTEEMNKRVIEDFGLSEKDIITDENIDTLSGPTLYKVRGDDGDGEDDDEVFIPELQLSSVYNELNDYAEGVCNDLELKLTVSVERGKWDNLDFLEEEVAMNIFGTVHLFKFCKSNSFISMEKIVKDNEDFRHSGQSLFEGNTLKVLKSFFKAHGFEDSIHICRGGKIDTKGIDELKKCNSVLCRRIFTKEEWERGVPYEHNNLRHWKTKPRDIHKDKNYCRFW